MAIKSLKQAQAAIEDLQEQIKALRDDLASEKDKTPPAPPKVDLSGIDSGLDTLKDDVESLQAGIAVLADQVTEFIANPPTPDVDTLIRILEEKVMLRKR